MDKCHVVWIRALEGLSVLESIPQWGRLPVETTNRQPPSSHHGSSGLSLRYFAHLGRRAERDCWQRGFSRGFELGVNAGLQRSFNKVPETRLQRWYHMW